jgi:hypothetical protein
MVSVLVFLDGAGDSAPGRHVTLRYCVDSLRSVRLSLFHAIGAVMPEEHVAEPCVLLGQSATAAVTEESSAQQICPFDHLIPARGCALRL